MKRKKKAPRLGARLVAQMESMRRDLGLRMPSMLYSVAIDYYKSEERREPSPEELLLLDRHSAILSKSRHSASVSELLTNDSFVAATYADMMEKRRAINPNHNNAPLLSELLELADTYLARSGKTAVSSSGLSLESIGSRSVSSNAARLCTENAAFLLRIMGANSQPCAEKELLLLLSPLDAEGEVDAPLSNVLADRENPLQYKELLPIGDMGLLAELLALPLGVEISSSRLLRNHTSLISALTDLHIGDYILRIDPTTFEDTAKRLQSVGIRATAFASLSKNHRITVRSNGEETVSLSKEFLSRFYLFDRLNALLEDESATPNAPIFQKPLTAGASKYLDFCDFLPTVTSLDGGVIVSAASSVPTSDYFLNAVDTALAAIFSLAASGVPYTEQALAVGLAIPKNYRDPARLGAIVSMILGLYRVEAELAVRTVKSRISTVESDASPALSLFSLASGNTSSDHFSAEGGYVSMLAPTFESTGLPNFEVLRAMLAYLTELAQSGRLKGVRILAHEPLLDALDSMQTATLGYRLNDPNTANGRTPRLAILCQTAEPIDAELLGTVVMKDEALEKADAEISLESAMSCLIPSEHPAFVLYSSRADRDADLLAEQLANFDVKLVRIYANEEHENIHLCRAILTSQVLIVGADVELPSTQSVRFAVGTLARAKGQILYPARDSLSAKTKGIAVPKGFEEKMLRDLCYFEKD